MATTEKSLNEYITSSPADLIKLVPSLNPESLAVASNCIAGNIGNNTLPSFLGRHVTHFLFAKAAARKITLGECNGLEGQVGPVKKAWIKTLFLEDCFHRVTCANTQSRLFFKTGNVTEVHPPNAELGAVLESWVESGHLGAPPSWLEDVFYSEVYLSYANHATNLNFFLEKSSTPAFEQIIQIPLDFIQSQYPPEILQETPASTLKRRVALKREARENTFDVERAKSFVQAVALEIPQELLSVNLTPLRHLIQVDPHFERLKTDPVNWASELDVVGDLALRVRIGDAVEQFKGSGIHENACSPVVHKAVIDLLTSDTVLVYLYDCLMTDKNFLPGGKVRNKQKPYVIRAAVGLYSLRSQGRCEAMLVQVIDTLVFYVTKVRRAYIE